MKIKLDKHGDYDYVEKKLNSIVKNSKDLSLASYKEELEKTKKRYLQLSLILYSFIGIVALVSIINIFNIMSMNVMLRKKEFGMLRAIGMGKDEVNSMIRKESLSYGIYSILWGISLGTIVTYMLFMKIRKIFAGGMKWSFPVLTIVSVGFVVLGVCFLAAVNSSKKLYSDSIVDSIRTIE